MPCAIMHGMEWSDLRIFLIAVRTGTYTAAARQLGVNRTTVGRRIEALERAAGHALFIHGPTGHEPSAEGRRLLASAARIEAEIDGLRAALELGDVRPDSIRIASSAGIASEFLPEIAAYQREEPGTTIELVGAIDPLEAVTQRRADLAIALVRRPPRRLTGVEIGTLLQADYVRKGGDRNLLLGWGREIEAAIPGQWTTANPTGDDAEETCAARFNAWPQLKQAVLAGLGRAALWCFVADAEPGLERLSAPDPRHGGTLWLLYRAGTPPSPRLRALLVFLERTLRDRIGEGDLVSSYDPARRA